jgi:hypothetical protein
VAEDLLASPEGLCCMDLIQFVYGTHMTLVLQFEKFTINFVIKNLSLDSKTIARPVCFLTISIIVSIQLTSTF